MKRIYFLLGLLFFFSCHSIENQLTDVTVARFETLTDLNLEFGVSSEDFESISQLGRDWGTINFDQNSYFKLQKTLKEMYGVEIINYSTFSDGLEIIKSNLKESNSIKEGMSKYSLEGQYLIAEIRNLLSASVDENTFISAVQKSQDLIYSSNLESSFERDLILSNLNVVQRLALEEEEKLGLENGRILSTSPKCKWYQWGCVFYMSSAQLPVLLAFYLINQYSPLAILVAEYGINYIAQCCGWCYCECPLGCPSII